MVDLTWYQLQQRLDGDAVVAGRPNGPVKEAVKYRANVPRPYFTPTTRLQKVEGDLTIQRAGHGREGMRPRPMKLRHPPKD